MALEAFYKLKDKKKKNVLGAISSCLKRMSYDELSVNDIVVEADISRGSFYNYFADKYDAVKCLVESRVRDYFDMYMDAIQKSDNNLFEGTRELYKSIINILSVDINITVMRNMKFFTELVFETVKSNEYKKYLDEIIDWFIKNTVEGKKVLNSRKKMLNVLDIIISLIMNSIFLEAVFKMEPFNENSDFEYKLKIIEKGIF